ncbi:MAG: 1-deoxy-D-xylulose-5-phosphate reductoisomerase [Bacteroidota bacterium]
MKQIAILGSTGSIGRSSLEVIANFPGGFQVTCLTAKKNIDLLYEQIKQFQPRCVVVVDRHAASELRSRLNSLSGSGMNIPEVLDGEQSLIEVVQRDDVDLALIALVGFSGVQPTIAALKAKKIVALANKEALVAAGEIITRLLHENGGTLIPVDSEHSAVLQCLVGESKEAISNLILTASGGPFLHTPVERLRDVTVKQALNHPNWSMGQKITIDSATLMNKGLEVIEAHYLFNLPAEKIHVVIHPQSIIHSMVEFIDGSIKAQLSVPDMKIPIQYALTYPSRVQSTFNRLDFSIFSELTFMKPDKEKFRSLALAYNALALGGTAPAVLNAANEVAVDLFLNGIIRFTEISTIVESALDEHVPSPAHDIETIIAVDREIRQRIQETYFVHDKRGTG